MRFAEAQTNIEFVVLARHSIAVGSATRCGYIITQAFFFNKFIFFGEFATNEKVFNYNIAVFSSRCPGYDFGVFSKVEGAVSLL